MPMRMPSADELHAAAARMGFVISDDEMPGFLRSIADALPGFDRLDQLPQPVLPVRYPRTDPGHRPVGAENPYNGWAWRCSIKGAETGPLAGRTVAFKDHTRVAGIPMRNSSQVFDGYIPAEDATIVTRMLDAGAEVVGKTVLGACSFDAGGISIYPGPQPLNPVTGRHLPGGSSNGSAIVVASGQVDFAFGGDQGGSIRGPAAWCGIVGLKPTFGLVPHTGILGVESTIDHTGPMARNVRDCALALQAVAGPDGLDPRQGSVAVQDYVAALEDGIDGLRVGVLREGFGLDVSQPEVDQAVEAAAESLAGLGAHVSPVSVPMHADGWAILFGAILQGSYMTLKTDGVGVGHRGHYPVDLADFLFTARRARANDYPVSTKMAAMLGDYVYGRYGHHYYAKATNLFRTLRAEFDRVLAAYDVLVMPTLPHTAPEHPSLEEGRVLDVYDSIRLMIGNIQNTGPFNATGHPALSVPCGTDGEGLPIGMQIVGRHFEDDVVLRVGLAHERSRG
jgi:amidase